MTSTAANLWVCLSFVDRISTQDCGDVLDVIEATKRRFTPHLDRYPPAFISLYALVITYPGLLTDRLHGQKAQAR